MSKEERAKLAIAKRAQEIREQKEKDEASRQDRERLEREAEEIRQKERGQSNRYGGGGGGRCQSIEISSSVNYSLVTSFYFVFLQMRIVGTPILNETGMAEGTVAIIEEAHHLHNSNPRKTDAGLLEKDIRMSLQVPAQNAAKDQLHRQPPQHLPHHPHPCPHPQFPTPTPSHKHKPSQNPPPPTSPQ